MCAWQASKYPHHVPATDKVPAHVWQSSRVVWVHQGREAERFVHFYEETKGVHFRREAARTVSRWCDVVSRGKVFGIGDRVVSVQPGKPKAIRILRTVRHNCSGKECQAPCGFAMIQRFTASSVLEGKVEFEFLRTANHRLDGTLVAHYSSANAPEYIADGVVKISVIL